MKKYLKNLRRLDALDQLHEETVLSYLINKLSIQSLNVGIKALRHALHKCETLTDDDRKRKGWLLDKLNRESNYKTQLINQRNYIRANIGELEKGITKTLEGLK